MVKYKQENLTGTFVRRRKEEKDSMRSVRQKYISLILILSMFSSECAAAAHRQILL